MLRLAFALMLVAGVFNVSFAGEGSVKGRLVKIDNKPLSDGLVFFFSTLSPLERPVTGKFWRVPDVVHNTDSTGTFDARLPEGEYYVAAIKRSGEGRFGPPQDGDFFLPVHDQKGVYRSVKVIAGKVSDIGAIKGVSKYDARKYVFKGDITSLEGRIVSADGAPVAGMSILAYLSSEMTGPPQFVSATSDATGAYRLMVDKGRTVYLKVRSGYAGGTPPTGALLGVYGDVENPEPAVAVTGKRTKGIDIEVAPFRGRGKGQ